MNSQRIAIAYGLLTGLCVLVFVPGFTLITMVKPLVWWPGLLFLLGCVFLCAPSSRLSGRIRAFSARGAEYKYPLLIGVFWAVWCVGAAGFSPDRPRAVLTLAIFASQGLTILATLFLLSGTMAAIQWKRMAGWAFVISALYTLLQAIGVDWVQWMDTRRAGGTFGNPNFTAEAFAAFLPLMLVGEWQWNPHSRSDGRGWRTLARRVPFCSLLLILALLATFSRAGLIGLGAGLVTLTALLWRRAARRDPADPPGRREAALAGFRRLRILFLSGILLLEILFLMLFRLAPQRLEHVLQMNTPRVRWEMWSGSLQQWKEKPWTGWGLGSYRLVEEKFKYRLEPIGGDRYAFHPHNWLIELLVEQGVIGAGLGLLFLGGVMALFLQKGLAARDEETALVLFGILAGMVALLAGTFFCVWLNRWEGGWLLALLIGAGMGVATDHAPPPLPPAGNSDAAETGVPQQYFSAKWITGAVFIVLGSMAFWGAVVGYRAERLHFEATKLLRHGDWRAALPVIEKARGLMYYPAQMEFLEAEAFYRGKDYGKAAEAWERLAGRSALYSDILILRGCIERERHRPAGARRFFEAAYAREPSGDKAIALGRYYFSEKEIVRARLLLQNQLQRALYPSLLDFYAQSEKQLGAHREARRFLWRLEEMQPFVGKSANWGEWAAQLADLSLMLNEPGPAVSFFHQALLRDPGRTQWWANYGLALRQVGRFERADQAFLRAHQLNPGHLVPIYNRMELAFLRKNYALTRQLLHDLKSYPVPREQARRMEQIQSELDRLDSPREGFAPQGHR
jgi:O-antigen ligase/tetratricopeptide (TPR) repeat protein